MPPIDISVVVCTYNRSELLRGAVESLMRLRTEDRLRYEVLVIDNASTDDTPQVIEELKHIATVPLRSVREMRKGVAAARNCGIRSAHGDWIAFFDDDELADPLWLLELLDTAKRKDACCAGGAVRLALPDDVLAELPMVCRHSLGESATPAAPCRFHRKLTITTGNLMVHRIVFDEIGLFDETLREAGEDTDLSSRMWAAGIESWFVPSAIIYHTVAPYRLEERYFRWTSQRNGLHLARRERHAWGLFLFPAVLFARVARFVVKHLPQLLRARATGSRPARLAALCQWWRIEGYLRAVASWVTPRWWRQEEFFASMDFRNERQMFSTPAATAPVAEESAAPPLACWSDRDATPSGGEIQDEVRQ
jgi:glycosyltransferase involved in cell wall biosynthesis